MLLKPIQTVLAESGVIKKGEKNSTPIAEILNEQGLTLEAAADGLRDLACSADNSVRLRALEMGFKLHGVLKEADKGNGTPIVINIVGDQNKIQAILEPR